MELKRANPQMYRKNPRFFVASCLIADDASVWPSRKPGLKYARNIRMLKSARYALLTAQSDQKIFFTSTQTS
jgi:hypothetical protein